MAKDERAATMTPPKAQTPPQAATEKVKPSGEALIAHLRETGTPPERLLPLENHLVENPGASAEILYRKMDAEHAPLGTLRKAGKFAFGASFEPDEVNAKAPAEEIVRLREVNQKLVDQLAQSNVKLLSMTKQRDLYMEKLNESVNKVRALSMGKTPEELILAGV